MMEADSEIIRPEMLKDYVWLQTSDDSVQEVEQEVAKFCPFISSEIESGMGSSKNNPILLPPLVNSQILSPILKYCRFHHLPGHSTKDIKNFNRNFVQKDITTLLELSYAANSLQLNGLVDLTNCAAARMIEEDSPEEISELPDDLTEEEKLEPIINTMGDPKIRLLNRLNAKKRKELEERQIIKNIEVEEHHSDDRPVDDLIAFINGGSEGMQDGLIYMKHYRASYGDEFDDDFDRARQEEIDREVEEFERRLKLAWSKVKRAYQYS